MEQRDIGQESSNRLFKPHLVNTARGEQFASFRFCLVERI